MLSRDDKKMHDYLICLVIDLFIYFSSKNDEIQALPKMYIDLKLELS